MAGRPVTGNLELDNVMFEAAAAYLASEPAQLAIIGGLRTYTLSPKIGLTTAGGGVTPVAGLGVRFKPWLALAFGCKGLGIDVDATLLLTYAGDGGEASSSRASGPSRARTRRCYS